MALLLGTDLADNFKVGLGGHLAVKCWSCCYHKDPLLEAHLTVPAMVLLSIILQILLAIAHM